MRIKLSIALLGLAVMMLVLAGCGSNSNNTTYLLTGSVVTPAPANDLVPNFTLTFFLNGTAVGSPMSSTNGMFSYGISPGRYTIEASGTLTGETTFLGPLEMTSSQQSVTIISPTALSQLPPGNITLPIDNTGTLVALAVNSFGIAIPQSFTVTVGTQVTPSQMSGIYSYAPVQGVPNTTTSVVITPTGGQGITVSNVTFAPNSVVLLDAIMPSI